MIQGLSQNWANITMLEILSNVVKNRPWPWGSPSDKQSLTTRPSDSATSMKSQDTESPVSLARVRSPEMASPSGIEYQR